MALHTEEEKAALKAQLQEEHDEVLTTEEMTTKYEVLGFAYGYCMVKRRKDGQKGSLNFTHLPRFYYDFRGG